MVDAQAPGLAARVRELGAIPSSGPGWPVRLLEECALLHLLDQGWLRRERLPDGLAATVRSRVGLTGSADGPPVRDHWLVLAQYDTSDGRLTTRRIWLHGAESGAPGRCSSPTARPAAHPSWPCRSGWRSRRRCPRTRARGSCGRRWASSSRPGAHGDPPAGADRGAGGGPVRRGAAGRPLAGLLAGDARPRHTRPRTATPGNWPTPTASSALPAHPRRPVRLRPVAPGRPLRRRPGHGLRRVRPPRLHPAHGLAGGPGRGGAAVLTTTPDASGTPTPPTDRTDPIDVTDVTRPRWIHGRDSHDTGPPPATSTRPHGTRPAGAAGRSSSPRRCWGPTRRTPPGMRGRAGRRRRRCWTRPPWRPCGAGPGCGRRGRRPGPEPAAADPRPRCRPRPRADWRCCSPTGPDGGGSGGRRGTAPDLMELLPAVAGRGERARFAAPPAGAARAAGRGPGAYGSAAGGAGVRRAARAVAGPAEPGLAVRAAADAGRRRGAARARGARADPASCGRRGCSPSGSRCSRRYGPGTPAAARDLLATTWATERAEDRLMFLDSLRTGLCAADEPFLERALADRSRNVRATAAELLSALPGSALAGADGGPARRPAWPSTARSGTPTIVVEAPHECDPGMERDGVRPQGLRQGGVNGPGGWASWWRRHRSATWSRRLGGRTPEEIVALPVADDWQDELHAAWCRAAVRQRDPAWSRALLGAPAAPEAGGPGAVSLAERAKLLGTLGAGGAGRLGGGVHRRARPVRGVPAARGVRGALGGAPGAGRGRRARHRAGRGQLPMEFQRGDGPGRTLPGPRGGGPSGALTAVPDETGGRGPGRRRLLGGGLPAPGHHPAPARGDAERTRRRSRERTRGSRADRKRIPDRQTSSAPLAGKGRGEPATSAASQPAARSTGQSHADANPRRTRRSRCRTFARTHSTIDAVVAPGVKISATPFSFSGAMSASGMIPPPNTLMSSASRSFRSSITAREERVVRAGEDGQPDRVGVLLDRRVDDLLGRLVEPGVDDLHTGVAQRPRDHLGPAVVAVEPRLGHHHADRTGCHTHHCLHEPTAPIYRLHGTRRSDHADLPRPPVYA